MLSAERITTEIVEPETPTCYKRPRNAKTSDQEIVEAKMAGHEGRRSLVPSIFADENHELREAPAPSSALTVTPKKAPKRCAAPPSLGVALVWVRRRERRRGLATALVDCLRRLNGGATVAFSQPTDLGFAFATRYSRQQRFDSPMVGPQQGGQGLSVAELEAAKRREDEDNESAVQLRGLPYRATMQDVKDGNRAWEPILHLVGECLRLAGQNFLKHHAKNLKDDPNAVQLVLNRDGRPSGFGRVQFKTQEMARACRDEMPGGPVDPGAQPEERYVEIFLYSERPNKLRFKKIVGDGPEHPDDAVEALGITKQHVLDECRAHMSMEGKSQLLLSMLGVALSPASRLYLKKTDQGLKHFLASCPNEFMVDGSKGRELITYLGNKKEEPRRP
eukprot:g20533.t1